MGSLGKKAAEFLKNVANVLVNPPPKTWDPTTVTMRGWMKRFSDIWRTQGLGAAYNTLRMENVLRTGGTLVGVDANGIKYFEDLNAPSGHHRYVEYPVVKGVWALEDKYDASQISPDWHGWIHYMHDKPGSRVKAEFAKPFAQPHTINQTMMRTCYTTPEGITSKNNSEGLPDGFHQPPGALRARVKRGRIGPKYQVIQPHPEALS